MREITGVPASRRAWLRLWSFSRSDRELIGIWLFLRITTALWAAFVSAQIGLTVREQQIAAWPPAAPYGSWLERVLLAPWERRDTVYYVNIVAQGYRVDDGTAQFHPLLAWLATPVAALTGSPLLGLLAVSAVAGAALLLAFARLASLDLEPRATRDATVLLAFSPLAFVLFAPYTEALFLLWTVLCLLWARQGRWWLAGLAGALATLTRQQGIFLVLPLAWEIWHGQRSEQQTANSTSAPGSWLWPWLALGLIPAALLFWLAYRAAVLGDLRPDLSHPQALIYSLLISPSSSKVVPEQAFLWPWHALWLALTKLWRAPEYSLVIDLTLGGAFVALLAVAWPYLRGSYRIWSLTAVLLSFAYYTGPHYPYMGLPRHLLLAFPVFVGLGAALRNRFRTHLLLVAFGFLGMLFLQLQYHIHGWVP